MMLESVTLITEQSKLLNVLTYLDDQVMTLTLSHKSVEISDSTFWLSAAFFCPPPPLLLHLLCREDQMETFPFSLSA